MLSKSFSFFIVFSLVLTSCSFISEGDNKAHDGIIENNEAFIEAQGGREDQLRPSNRTFESALVAHALGAVGEQTGTNSREALEESYANGFRLFEVDLSVTSDGEVVVFHKNAEGSIGFETHVKIDQIPYADFIAATYLDQYTLMHSRELLQFMREHEDMYLISDTKGDIRMLQAMIQQAQAEEEKALLDRIIPQLYQPEDLAIVERIYAFPEYILTLYRTDLTNEEVIQFAQNNPKITAITMWWDSRYTEAFQAELDRLDVGSYVHTVNDEEIVSAFLAKNVGVYTDFMIDKEY